MYAVHGVTERAVVGSVGVVEVAGAAHISDTPRSAEDPRLECRRRGLYQPSMKPNTARRASPWVRNERRRMSSHSSVAKNDSHMALS